MRGISARHWLESRLMGESGAWGRYLGQSGECRVQRKMTSTWAENAGGEGGRLEWHVAQWGAISLCKTGASTSPHPWAALRLRLSLIYSLHFYTPSSSFPSAPIITSFGGLPLLFYGILTPQAPIVTGKTASQQFPRTKS